MSTRFLPSSFVSLGVVSVISLASIGLAGAPVNAQASTEAILDEYSSLLCYAVHCRSPSHPRAIKAKHPLVSPF